MLKELRKLAYLSMALVAMSYGSHTANAAPSFLSAAGLCAGATFSSAGGQDCVTTTGHISASVVGSLTINELRAISFGNMAAPCAGGACAGGGTIVLDPTTGSRTAAGADAIILLRGASANSGNPGTGPGGVDAGNILSGGQSPGILEVTTGAEGGTTQVYISFADTAGQPIDFAGEDFYTANDNNIVVAKQGASAVTFTMQDFTIDCTATGDDVFGHYCDNAGGTVQVKVGATLVTTAGTTYTVGKYTGMYNAMVSY